MWKVIVFLFSAIQLNGQIVQDTFQKDTDVIEGIKSYYFPNENIFALFFESESTIEFDRFHNYKGQFEAFEAVRIILISKKVCAHENEYIFILLKSPLNSNEIIEKDTIDFKLEVLRTVEFGVIDGIISYETETDFEPI
jgi:hypothetical protein